MSEWGQKNVGGKKNHKHAEYFQINGHPLFMILFLKEGKRHLYEVERPPGEKIHFKKSIMKKFF